MWYAITIIISTISVSIGSTQPQFHSQAECSAYIESQVEELTDFVTDNDILSQVFYVCKEIKGYRES